MKNAFVLAVALTLVSMADAVSAQSITPWDGFYLGASLGGENTNVCNRSVLTGLNIDPATSTFASCSSGGLVGGLQLGENFQIARLVLGIGADLVFSRAKNSNSTLTLTGADPPAGIYTLSGKLSPKDFAIIGGRIGYGGNLIFPYIRAGAVVTSSESSTLAYTPTATATPTASFGGGSNSATTCAGATGACSAFAGVSLENAHNAFTASIIRVGINYWFNYWDKP